MASSDKLTLSFERDVRKLLSKEICQNLGIVPISIDKSVVSLGAMNPMYSEVSELVETIESRFSLKVNIKQITIDQFEKWSENETDLVNSQQNHKSNVIEERKSINSRSGQKKTTLTSQFLNKFIKETNLEDSAESQNKFDLFESEIDSDDDVVEESDIFDDNEFQDQSDPVVSAVGQILSSSEKLGASDIHAEPLEERMRIRYRVDGVLKEVYSLPKSRTRAIISRIKVMSRLDIAEKRLPQDGRIRYKVNNKILDFRVSTLPGKWGEKIVLRALQSDSSLLKLDKLINFSEELKEVRSMGNSPYGIFIVVGPTGSGKSTTLYSILNERNTDDVNISTVEDPVEYTLDGIHQVQVIREKGLDFARALRSLMRQDPDIILVGETRDKETAHTAMEAALTGHMVFTTLHANDTATAITRLAEMGVPPYLVGSSVIGVMAQRLIRKVCPKCSSSRAIDPEKDQLPFKYGIKHLRQANIQQIQNDEIQDLNFNQDLCSECNGAGYKGRLGLYEVMRVNDPIRELIMKSSTADVIRECAVKHGLRNLLDYGMKLVELELTTLEEVERVCLLEESQND